MSPVVTRCLHSCGSPGRRRFLRFSALAAVAGSFTPARLLAGLPFGAGPEGAIRALGPASTYTPTIEATFTRRREAYGMWWPGAVYDGGATEKMYREKLSEAAAKLGARLRLREAPVYSLEEARAWAGEARDTGADGLLVMVHDRQQHAWPTVHEAVATGVPTVAFSPLGTSFTTNTIHLADAPGCVIFSTDDFTQAELGLKMLGAGARMRRTRCVVLKGDRRFEAPLADTGISLRHVPARTFLDEYERMETTEELRRLAEEYMSQARRVSGATTHDVVNGLKAYLVAGRILEREEADAITMDCLGALGTSTVSLPCIAWSRMNDDGIPAACEADPGAVAAHVITQLLFDRPGFQQDPVAETSVNGIIGAHCSCPTRLNGFQAPPEPFDLQHHHGNRDAVPRTLWKVGQRITCLDLLPAGEEVDGETLGRSRLLISTGTVRENREVPPAGGCVVSVLVEMDGDQEVLSFPGFHQLFFYGDFKEELKDFGQLQGFETRLV
jgi:hypothetical protein